MREITLKTKPDELCAQLLEMARRLGPGVRLPSSRALSLSYGVSRNTLDVALSRLEAQKVISRRQRSGIFVSQTLPQTTREVALVCNFNLLRSAGHSAFWEMLIEQAQGRAAQKNEVCQLHFTSPSSGAEGLLDSLKTEIREGRVQGVIGVGVNRAAIDWIAAQGVPLVTFAAWSQWVVGFDHRRVIELGVEELARQGCHRLGLWKPGGPFDSPSDNLKFASEDEATFRAALEGAALSFEPALLQVGMAQLERQTQETSAARRFESHQEQGYRLAMEVFGGPRELWPDGLVSTDDMMTHGALIALQKLGVRVGRDVKVATHANTGSLVMRGHDEEVCLLEVNPAELVQTMFDQLETLMDGQVPTQSKVLIAPRLRAPRD